MTKLISQILMTVGVVLFLQIQVIFACMCGHTSVSDMYKESNAIVRAKVISFESKEIFDNWVFENKSKSRDKVDGQIVKIKITKWFKGGMQVKTINLSQTNSTCDWHFSDAKLNKTYLFYLTYNKKNKAYSIISCGRSAPMNKANDDLSWLNNLPKSLNRARISGLVRLSDETNLFPSVGEIKIKIVGENKEYNLLTDKNGMYEIWDLPAGKYKIAAELPQNMKLGWTSSVPDNWTYFWSIDKPNEDSLIVTLEAKSSAGVDFMLQNK